MSKVSFAANGAGGEVPVAVESVNTVADAAGSVTTETVVHDVEVLPASHPIPAVVGGESVAVAPRTVDVPADVPSLPVAVPEQLFDDQDINFSDIILPRINIVQKVGDLSEVFNPGEIVLKQALVIYSPGKGEVPSDPPLNVTVLGFKKTQYTEKVAGGAMGLLAKTREEVVKAGGTLDYKEWEASKKAAAAGTGKELKLFQNLATALVLIEKPAKVKDEDHIQFPYECEGKYYALVLWSMKGTAYTHAAKEMFTARKIGHLKKGYALQSWSLSTKMDKFGENYAAVPIVKPASKTSDGFRAFIKEIIGSTN